jgi:hypothetical protein
VPIKVTFKKGINDKIKKHAATLTVTACYETGSPV